jgi:hypothetical protein
VVWNLVRIRKPAKENSARSAPLTAIDRD